MKKIFSILVLGLIFAACGGVEGEDPLQEELPTGSALSGAVVYAAQCATCHGADQLGDSGPSLADVTENELRLAVRDGKGSMPSFSKVQVTSQNLADLIALLVN